MSRQVVPAPPRASGHRLDVRAARRRRKRIRRRILLALMLAMLFPTASYVRALAAPGGGGWQVQSVEWVRDNGGAPVINAIENWWYGGQEPATGPPALSSLPQPVAGRLPPASEAAVPAPIAVPAGAAPLPGEGRWVPGRAGANGAPASYTTFERPDPAHTSVVAGVAWVRVDATTAHLVAGLRQPDGAALPGAGAVPQADVPWLVAAFNSGWKFRDIRGGFYLDGHEGPRLKDGEASVVIDDQGRVSVGQWGRDLAMSTHVRAVRQNLGLVIDRGRPVSGLADNGDGRWGSLRNQRQFTWRSGLGTDARGDLIYVAGHGLTLRTLADAMVQAGIQRGMELDIHSRMVTYSSWVPGAAGTVRPAHLLPDMPGPADRYLRPDQRDFFYLTVRGAADRGNTPRP